MAAGTGLPASSPSRSRPLAITPRMGGSSRDSRCSSLRASRAVRVHCLGGVTAAGEVLVVTDDIIELADAATSWLLAPDAITMVADLVSVLPPTVSAPPQRVPLTWGMALRPWTGSPLTVYLRDAAVSVRGHLDAVGADHLDMRPDAADDAANTVTVPFPAIAAIRCG